MTLWFWCVTFHIEEKRNVVVYNNDSDFTALPYLEREASLSPPDKSSLKANLSLVYMFTHWK